MIAGMSAMKGVSAQTPPVAPANTTVSLNYVYAASLGFGGYTVGGLTANVYTLPLSDTLQNVPTEGWELKLLLPGTIRQLPFQLDLPGRPALS